MSHDLFFRDTRRNWARGTSTARSVAGSSIGRATRAQRRARRLRRVQQLKARAAAGDPRAVAKLRKMQAALGLPVPTAAPLPPAYSPPPQSYAPAYQPAYQPSYAAAPAYQSPDYDESLSQDPFGPPPQPTVDVYQGEEERELARDGGSAERSALSRAERA